MSREFANIPARPGIIEAIIEMAIASFLDTEALSFADCKPGRGQ